MDTRSDWTHRGHGERSGVPLDAFDRDLHPDHLAGQDAGRREGDREVAVRSAFDFKGVHRALTTIPDHELKQVPVLREGERLRHGATYIDLFQPRRGEFRAMRDMVAGPNNAYVPKDEVADHTWSRLRGARNPDRH